MRRVIPVLPAYPLRQEYHPSPIPTPRFNPLPPEHYVHATACNTTLVVLSTHWEPWFPVYPTPSALAELQATSDAFISPSTRIPATDVPIDPSRWSKTAMLQCAVTTSRYGLQDTFNRAVSARYTILSEAFLRYGSPLEFYTRLEGRHVYYLCSTRTFDSFEPACLLP